MSPERHGRRVAALLAAVIIVGASILGAVLVLGTGIVAGTSGGAPGRGMWRQDMSALATLAVWQAIAVVLTVLASVLFGGRTRDVLALRPPGVSAVYLKAVLLMAALQVAVSAVQYTFLPQDMYADLRPFVRLFGEQWVLALLVVGVGAPLSEELLFRGFLLSALARSRLGFAGRRAGDDEPVDGPARRLFAGRHRRGVHDRPVLFLAAVADRQPAGAHVLPCAVQFADRAGAAARAACRREFSPPELAPESHYVSAMEQYLDLMRRVRTQGVRKTDRTGTGTLSVFGHQMRFDLAAGFPLVTTKKVHLKSIIHELIWFLAGDTNTKYLNANGVSIWDDWADENGDLGPSTASNGDRGRRPMAAASIRSARWWRRSKTNPDSRRMIVTAWNPADIPDMALAPCHCLFQFYVADGRLSCQLYQRSADVFLGVPFNIASYALLTMMMAQVTGSQPGEFIHTFGDAHLYLNHLEQADLQLTRTPRPLPRMEINPAVRSIFDFRYEDFALSGYDPHPHIKAAVAV